MYASQRKDAEIYLKLFRFFSLIWEEEVYNDKTEQAIQLKYKELSTNFYDATILHLLQDQKSPTLKYI